MEEQSNYRSIKEYADMCGVTTYAIYERLKKGMPKSNPTKAEKIKGKNGIEGLAINIDLYPPVKLTRGRKKFATQ